MKKIYVKQETIPAFFEGKLINPPKNLVAESILRETILIQKGSLGDDDCDIIIEHSDRGNTFCGVTVKFVFNYSLENFDDVAEKLMLNGVEVGLEKFSL